ncbi:MAG: cytochrome c family protein, partial [Nitrospinota bacterium]|nr:cytochrome c family protein [Nitrospinota bacterium]
MFRRVLFHSVLLLSLVVTLTHCSEGNPDVGSVVTLAKTGFGNSVFESAEQKCQHCHYDLYNTWADSMHAKSWSDPIFQSLYQRFLTHLMENKIGVSGPTGAITTKVAQNMGGVCLT